MIKILIKRVLGSVAGRWALGATVGLLLGGGALIWHNFKDGLREEGQQVCVQAINKQTVIDLQDALAAERVTVMELQALADARAEANDVARARRKELESKVDSLSRQMAEQAKSDEAYKTWADRPLPAGVGERLRNQATGSDPSPVRENSN